MFEQGDDTQQEIAGFAVHLWINATSDFQAGLSKDIGLNGGGFGVEKARGCHGQMRMGGAVERVKMDIGDDHLRWRPAFQGVFLAGRNPIPATGFKGDFRAF